MTVFFRDFSVRSFSRPKLARTGGRCPLVFSLSLTVSLGSDESPLLVSEFFTCKFTGMHVADVPFVSRGAGARLLPSRTIKR